MHSWDDLDPLTGLPDANPYPTRLDPTAPRTMRVVCSCGAWLAWYIFRPDDPVYLGLCAMASASGGLTVPLSSRLDLAAVHAAHGALHLHLGSASMESHRLAYV